MRWFRPCFYAKALIADLVATLLILLAMYGCTMLFHAESEEPQAEQPIASSMAKAMKPESR